ncbi:hypothetical protein Mth01_11560 [Sphaerimonospora thailandensis]|uniref:Uncharacterized protein n=1 Tax=Sphaerimonospora thailandensis TaxID=795644 RepID=A0A8J3R5J9_9ACTN|nr:hypothetical protein Mth01_11560 [Sphaerimonospora thailandensis]
MGAANRVTRFIRVIRVIWVNRVVRAEGETRGMLMNPPWAPRTYDLEESALCVFQSTGWSAVRVASIRGSVTILVIWDSRRTEVGERFLPVDAGPGREPPLVGGALGGEGRDKTADPESR